MAGREERLFSADPTVLRGHESGIWTVAIVRNKKKVAAGTSHGAIHIWDQQGNEWTATKQLKGHTDVVRVVAFIDDEGLRLLSGSDDHTIIEWDVEKGQQLFVFRGHAGDVCSLAVLVGNNIFVTCSDDRTVRFWDRVRREQVGLIQFPVQCFSVTVRTDSKHIVVGGYDSDPVVWDITACFSSSSSSPSSSSSSGAFDGSRSRLLKTLSSHSINAYSFAYSRDSALLAAGLHASTINVYDSSTDEYPLLRTLTGHGAAVQSISFVNNRLLFSGSNDRTIKLWDATDGRCIRTITTHTAVVRSVVVTADGALLVSGSNDKTVAIISRGEFVDVEELFGDIKNAANDCD